MFSSVLPGPNVIKKISLVIYDCPLQALVFVTGEPWQPSLLFVGKVKHGTPEMCLTQVGCGLTSEQ